MLKIIFNIQMISIKVRKLKIKLYVLNCAVVSLMYKKGNKKCNIKKNNIKK